MSFSEYDELLVWRCDTCGLRAKCPQEQGFGTSWNELKRAHGWRAWRDGDWEDASWSHHCRRCWRASQQKIVAELFGGKDMAELFGGKKHHLGTFCFEVDAAIAYNYNIAYLGLDKPLNVIPEGEWCHD